MIKKLPKLPKTLALTLVHLSLSSLGNGLSIPSLLNILQGISGGLVSDALNDISHKRLRQALFGIKTTDLGYSLSSLFYDAILRALDYVTLSYQTKCSDKQAIYIAQTQIEACKHVPYVNIKNKSLSTKTATYTTYLINKK